MANHVKMVKDGEEPIDVHPNNVEDHQRLGWKIAAEVVIPTEEETKAETKRKADEARAVIKSRK